MRTYFFAYFINTLISLSLIAFEQAFSQEEFEVTQFSVGTYQKSLNDNPKDGYAVKGTSFHIKIESIEGALSKYDAVSYVILFPNGKEATFKKWIRGEENKIKTLCSHHNTREDKNGEEFLPIPGEYQLKAIFNYKKEGEKVVAEDSFTLDKKESKNFLEPVDCQNFKHEISTEKAQFSWEEIEGAKSYQLNLYKMMSDLPAGTTSKNNITIEKDRKNYEIINISAYNHPPNKEFKSAHNQVECPIVYKDGPIHISHEQISTKQKKKIKVLD